MLGLEGYNLIAQCDKTSTSPGSDDLVKLLQLASPCLILIYEWVAFIRQLSDNVNVFIPAGTFDTNITFAQSLSEAVKATPGCLLVASIPASDIEYGGTLGKSACDRLQNVFSRMEFAWKPATPDESFEIVRRRLFKPIAEEKLASERDAVCNAFSRFYRDNSADFPLHCKEADYERRLKLAYPIHPELFDQLFNTWSSLDKFQRTRGVLRLMASVIYTLWTKGDKNLMIMPGFLPLAENDIQTELVRYLDDAWSSVIHSEVDGENSLAFNQDKANPNYGSLNATRRVTRTLFLGSAPTANKAQKGLEDKYIKLGSTQPGEKPVVFGDALRSLSDKASYLYMENSRYYFSNQPSVRTKANERAERINDDEINEEILKRIKNNFNGDFASVHIAPQSIDVPDNREIKLVILGSNATHLKNLNDSEAIIECSKILNYRGNSPRIYQNSLVFVAPDKTNLDIAKNSVKQYLAWKSIDTEKEQLNLDPLNQVLVRNELIEVDNTLKIKLKEAFIHLLIPVQDKPSLNEPLKPMHWENIKLTNGDHKVSNITESIVTRTWKKLENDENVVSNFGARALRHDLDSIPLWRDNHVEVKDLIDFYAKYLYLPKLRNSTVLLKLIESEIEKTIIDNNSFAYAQKFIPDQNKYEGFLVFKIKTLDLNDSGYLVKPDIANDQIRQDEEAFKLAKADSGGAAVNYDGLASLKSGHCAIFEPGKASALNLSSARENVSEIESIKLNKTRFYGSIELDAKDRFLSNLNTIDENIIKHLRQLNNSQVKIIIEIDAKHHDGFSDDIMRTIKENANTLKFKIFGFEES